MDESEEFKGRNSSVERIEPEVMEFDSGSGSEAWDSMSYSDAGESESARVNQSEQPAPNGPSTRGSTRRRKKEYAVSTRWEREVAERGHPNDVNKYFCCCARRLGHMFVVLEKPDGSPIVIAGPCWPFCMGVTVPLILGISGLVVYFVIINDDALPDWVGYIYYVVLALTMTALFCVSCRDPGLMERVVDEEAGQGGWFWNEQVGSFRPPGALYCRECGVMIQEYDHLCPWTGTGIGGGNMWAFKAFVISVNVLCYFSIGLVAYALLEGLAS